MVVWVHSTRRRTPCAPGPVGDRPQQGPADAATARLRRDRQRPDLRLVRAPHHLPGVRRRLQHDGAQDRLGRAVHRDQDLAGAVVTQRAEYFAVVRGVGEEPARLVGHHPQVADLGQLGGPGVAHDHPGTVPTWPTGRVSSPASVSLIGGREPNTSRNRASRASRWAS